MSALVFCNPLTSLSSFLSSSSSASASTFTVIPVSRLHLKPAALQVICSNGAGFQNPSFGSKNKMVASFIVKVSSDVGGASSADNNQQPAETETKEQEREEVVPVDKLPLESKLQERMEQKTKMKLAKKIRLRRKRLLRKRRMRKQGRWPPSKMKKLKNV